MNTKYLITISTIFNNKNVEYKYILEDTILYQAIFYFFHKKKQKTLKIITIDNNNCKTICYGTINKIEEMKKDNNKLSKIIDIQLEDKKMSINNFNIDCGKITDKSIALSMKGIAFKNKEGNYVAYDIKNNELINVNNFVINFDVFFKVPTSIKKIKENDIILYNNDYIIIKSISDDFKEIIGINVLRGEKICIIPTKNIFGFNYLTKIINLGKDFFSNFKDEINEDNPFGNLGFLMMLSNNNNDNDNNNNKSLIETLILNNYFNK